ncbi:hypothetical protein B0T16DRAFT_455923 [Cercophora newfieldiana]|uniref:Uncharacterized protein n=1 Tax=Cercophora newfieldiana TaxID=92897 RepID=A0AA39YAM8_9PEZI|nr:hypothetical protein B0T16DRAFT_455923 [Cercophora newfieldiana]
MSLSSWSTDDDSSSVDTALSDDLESIDGGSSDVNSEYEPDIDGILASLSEEDWRKVAELVETTVLIILQSLRSPHHGARHLSRLPTTPLMPSYPSDHALDNRIHQTPDSDDGSLFIVSRSNSPWVRIEHDHTPSPSKSPTFIWACLFALSNPQAHILCLRHQHDDPRALLRHLFRFHLRIPYCYRCGATFDYFVERNSHFAPRQCKVRENLPVFEGIGEGMISELQALVSSWDESSDDQGSVSSWDCILSSKAGLSDEEKYERIWRVVFPEDNFSERFPGGVNQEPRVKAVQAAREYWTKNGWEIVESAFKGRAGYERSELYEAVLDQIVRRVLADMAGDQERVSRTGT